MPPGLVRHDSSHADRVRSGNLPVVVLRNGTYYVHWGKKFSDSSVGIYSSDTSRSKSKTPFGSIKNVVFETMQNKKGTLQDYLLAENQAGDRVAFKVQELNVSIWEMNNWTIIISSLAAEYKFKLLGKYLSLLVKSEGFLNHTGK